MISSLPSGSRRRQGPARFGVVDRQQKLAKCRLLSGLQTLLGSDGSRAQNGQVAQSVDVISEKAREPRTGLYVDTPKKAEGRLRPLSAACTGMPGNARSHAYNSALLAHCIFCSHGMKYFLLFFYLIFFPGLSPPNVGDVFR